MNLKGRFWNENLAYSIHGIFKLGIVHFAASLTYQFFCLATGATIFNSMYLCTISLFTTTLTLVYTFNSSRYSTKMRSLIRGLYCENNYLNNRINLKMFLVFVLPDSIAEGIVIVVLALYSMQAQTSTDGHLEQLQTASVIIGILCIYSFIAKLYVASKHGRLVYLTYCFFIGALTAGLMVGMSHVGMLERSYALSLFSLASSGPLIILTVFLILLVSTIDYAIYSLWIVRRLFPVYFDLQRAMKANDQ